MTIPGYTPYVYKKNSKSRKSIIKFPKYDSSIVPQGCDFFTKAACSVFIAAASAACFELTGPAFTQCAIASLAAAGMARCGDCLGVRA